MQMHMEYLYDEYFFSIFASAMKSKTCGSIRKD